MTSRAVEGEVHDSHFDLHSKIQHASRECPQTFVEINGTAVKCLLDTGAQVSTVAEAFYKKYLSTIALSDTTKILKLSAANKLQIPYLGYIDVDLKIKDCVFTHVGMLVERVTTVGDPIQVVLGCNVLQSVRTIVKEEESSIVMDSSWDNVISVLDLADNTKRIGFVKVAGRTPIRIPANSMKVVLGSTRQNKKNETYSASVQAIACENGSLPKNLMIIDTMAKVENGKIPVKVVNIGHEDVWLTPKSRIGVAQEAEVIQSSADEYTVDISETELYIRRVDVLRGQERDVEKDSSQLLDTLKLDIGEVDFTGDQRKKLDDIFAKHIDAFSLTDDDMGYTSTITHTINLTDDVPIKVPHRRIPPNQIEEVKRHIQKLLNQGIIRKSSSPYASAVVTVRKKDGSIRLCVDYRLLNSRTIKDAYPLPRIEETLDLLNGAKYFSSIDLAQGYHQVAMEEKDIHNTAFRVGSGGLYEYLRMPFGLCNSPATFQRLMEVCLSEENFETLVLYLDDILVFSRTIEEHIQR